MRMRKSTALSLVSRQASYMRRGIMVPASDLRQFGLARMLFLAAALMLLNTRAGALPVDVPNFAVDPSGPAFTSFSGHPAEWCR